MPSEPTIFIVDDDQAVREALSFSLKEEGFQVECYASAQAFLEGYDPDKRGCLLLDIHMPGMSGREMIPVLVALRVDLPVIVITGRGDGELAKELMREGAADCLEKPFSREILLERIYQVLRQEDADDRC